MAKQSLFSACKRVFRDGISGTYTVGNNDIFLELYSQQDIDQNNEIGNSSEENIVVVAGDTITIPEGYTLTPVKPKKSLVVICNTFVNNGTVSMYQKAPNVLPHDLFIMDKQNYGNKDIIIPAYANNQKIDPAGGNNGTNRQCGSGGCSDWVYFNSLGNHTYSRFAIPGSGYAFGGGAGSGGIISGQTNYNGTQGQDQQASVNSTYPMRGGNGYGGDPIMGGIEGIGNPNGNRGSQYQSGTRPPSGCGGRIIIFCSNFANNGIITVNGTNQTNFNNGAAYGGASGAGAVDLFYTNLNEQGNITANGGTGPYAHVKGGDGSITLTPWEKSSILKPTAKYMSKENMVYFLTNYIERLKQGED